MKCKNHPDKKAQARGLCNSCYGKWYNARRNKLAPLKVEVKVEPDNLIRELLERELMVVEQQISSQEPLLCARRNRCLTALRDL